MAEIYDLIKSSLEEDRLFAIATVISGASLGKKALIFPDGASTGDLGVPAINQQTIEHAMVLFKTLDSGKVTLTIDGEDTEIFIDVSPPKPKLVIIGAVHIAVPLIKYAKVLGFRTIIIDARAAFATRERFPTVDELIIKWPSDALEEMSLDEGAYIVALTHDDKLDNPALLVALQNPVRYIGALGSRKTHANRLTALRAEGATEEQLVRIQAPIGLNLGAVGPQEVALSIMAEIIAVRHGVREKV